MTKAECKEKYMAACEDRYGYRTRTKIQATRLFEACWAYYEGIRYFVSDAAQNWNKERYMCLLCGSYSDKREPCQACKKSNYDHSARSSTEISSLAWNYANWIYNRGDGLVFMDFNEREQKCYLKAGFATFIAIIRDAVNEELEKCQMAEQEGK